MLEQSKNEIEKLMNLFRDDVAGLNTKKEAEKASLAKFGTEFEKLKKEIVWPVIVEVGNYLTEYGHDFHISEEKEYTDSTATYHPASITFNIYPSTISPEFKKPDSAPYISFVANPYAKKVGITVSTMMPGEGGIVGTHGEYEFSGLTKDFVEKEIILVLKNTLIFHQS